MTTILRLGARLRAARKAAGFKTSKEFLEKHSVPASTYSQHESGSRSPNDETLLFYSKIFGVNQNWLTTGKGLPYKNLTPSQKNIMTEELTVLNKEEKPLINEKLLVTILQEAFKSEKIATSKNTISRVIKKSVQIYLKFSSANISSEKIKRELDLLS